MTVPTVHGLDPTALEVSPPVGLALAVMVGFLVFAVALDLTVAQFARVLKAPRAIGVGLGSQIVVLPAVAWGVGMQLANRPGVALGLLLVACCPAGALSNYLTGLARGSVATSVSLTAVSTATSLVATPLLFAGWASLNPDTEAVVARIAMDPARVVLVLLVMMILPVAAGMSVRTWRPGTAIRIRPWIRRIAVVLLAVVVATLLLRNLHVLVAVAHTALPPVLVTFSLAVGLGWGLARAAGVGVAERRAVTLEVAFQNVAVALGLAVAFFPEQPSVAITCILWGIVHLTLGVGIAAAWRLVPVPIVG